LVCELTNFKEEYVETIKELSSCRNEYEELVRQEKRLIAEYKKEMNLLIK
jgi:hypothetical protein